MKVWMMLLTWILTGSQCNHLSPTQEAVLVHHRTSTEVEQTEVCQKMVTEGLEIKEVVRHGVLKKPSFNEEDLS